eukprot:Gb_24141 [translate_table: standard]
MEFFTQRELSIASLNMAPNHGDAIVDNAIDFLHMVPSSPPLGERNLVSSTLGQNRRKATHLFALWHTLPQDHTFHLVHPSSSTSQGLTNDCLLPSRLPWV